MKYLDPKADLTFKKVFGEHPDLVISLLNALLPLEKGDEVQSVEYLTPEMVPETPTRKNSIVDVRCKDMKGRQFLVEMQMIWSSEFKQRVLFNASKAYVRQFDSKENFKLLQPVYSLNLVDAVFEPDVDTYYHYYRLVHEQYSNKIIDGLHLVFVELPKFKPVTYAEKKMQVLWLRFLSEIDEKTREVPDELLDNPEIKKALDIVEQSAFSDVQLTAYEKFWDSVRVERALTDGVREEAERNKAIEITRNLKAMGLSVKDIAKATGLSEEEITKI
ncbi:MAG: Rpn family recombination-promoting nuclease/putative transposase [Bacteroidales bacterium]|nr:Rpn family recombination-promoting nuclease/putative transposase [Bacteroidales bacterium]